MPLSVAPCLQAAALAPAERLLVEEWVEWVETALLRVALSACSGEPDAAELQALSAQLERRLAKGHTVSAAAGVTAADVLLWAFLHPLLAPGGLSGATPFPRRPANHHHYKLQPS